MTARLELFWIPLGAGNKVVRFSAKTYEAVCAITQRRPRGEVYHSALLATTSEGSWVIEVAPIPDDEGESERGVVAEGSVGTQRLQRLRAFRYEVRRWHGGVIIDLSYAVGSPVRISDDPEVVQQVLDAVPLVPTRVWGRDELHVGAMWNSNSVTSWVLVQAGVLSAAGPPPVNGRAPGWEAGVFAALTASER